MWFWNLNNDISPDFYSTRIGLWIWNQNFGIPWNHSIRVDGTFLFPTENLTQQSSSAITSNLIWIRTHFFYSILFLRFERSWTQDKNENLDCGNFPVSKTSFVYLSNENSYRNILLFSYYFEFKVIMYTYKQNSHHYSSCFCWQVSTECIFKH